MKASDRLKAFIHKHHDFNIRKRQTVTIDGEKYYRLACNKCDKTIIVPTEQDLYRIPKDLLKGCTKRINKIPQ